MMEMTTRERIIQSAIELFAQKGYTETSIKEIGRGCGIQAASIYNHFESKNEILECILQEYADYIRENIPADELLVRKSKTEDPKKLLMSMFYPYGVKNVKRYADILKIILHEHLRNEHIGKFFENYFLCENERRLDFLLMLLMENKRIPSVNHRYYAKIFNSLVLSMSIEYCHFAKSENYEKEDRILTDELLGFIIDTLSPNKGPNSGD